MASLKIGEYREGVVLSQANNGSLVDIGVENPLLVSGKRLSMGDRVTVKVADLGKKPEAVLADRREIQTYWGYVATVSDVSLGRFVKTHHYDLVIATSKHGKPYTDVKDDLHRHLAESHSVLIAFGAPTQGLNEILAKEHLELDEVADFSINMIPNQGTETVRTEEAVFASLALLNILDATEK